MYNIRVKQSYIKALKQEFFLPFYPDKRALKNNNNFIIPYSAWQGGDPHITTLDGLKYTFNGLGEYTMIDASNGSFILQVFNIILIFLHEFDDVDIYIKYIILHLQ